MIKIVRRIISERWSEGQDEKKAVIKDRDDGRGLLLHRSTSSVMRTDQIETFKQRRWRWGRSGRSTLQNTVDPVEVRSGHPPTPPPPRLNFKVHS